MSSPKIARALIRPTLCGKAFLADVQAVRAGAATDPIPDTFQLWWLNQSAFLLHWCGHMLLLDPYLSDSLTQKYAATDKPHVRLTERVIDPGELSGVSLVTASHAHTDHLDAATLRPLVAVNPGLVLVGPEANRTIMGERSGLPDEQIVGLDTDPALGIALSTTVGPWTVHAIPAAHETLGTDAVGRHHYLGFVIQFGGFSVYHSGDTVQYPGMVERIRTWAPQIVLLPINGRTPERRVAGNLWGDEAAQIAFDVRATVAIPMHYDLFEFNTATPDIFVEACQKLGQGYRILQAGERWTARLGDVSGGGGSRF